MLTLYFSLDPKIYSDFNLLHYACDGNRMLTNGMEKTNFFCFFFLFFSVEDEKKSKMNLMGKLANFLRIAFTSADGKELLSNNVKW